MIGDVVHRYDPQRAVQNLSMTVKPFAMAETRLCLEFTDIEVRTGSMGLGHFEISTRFERFRETEANLRSRPALGVGLIAEVVR